MRSLNALELALALHAEPALAPMLRSRPLPAGVTELLRVAAAQSKPLAEAALALNVPGQRLIEASRFFIEQQLLARECEADPWRVLGVNVGDDGTALASHRRLLVSLVHPDRSDDWDPAFSDRIHRAWRAVRSNETNAPVPDTVSAASSEMGRRSTPAVWNQDDWEPALDATPQRGSQEKFVEKTSPAPSRVDRAPDTQQVSEDDPAYLIPPRLGAAAPQSRISSRSLWGLVGVVAMVLALVAAPVWWVPASEEAALEAVARDSSLLDEGVAGAPESALSSSEGSTATRESPTEFVDHSKRLATEIDSHATTQSAVPEAVVTAIAGAQVGDASAQSDAPSASEVAQVLAEPRIRQESMLQTAAVKAVDDQADAELIRMAPMSGPESAASPAMEPIAQAEAPKVSAGSRPDTTREVVNTTSRGGGQLELAVATKPTALSPPRSLSDAEAIFVLNRFIDRYSAGDLEGLLSLFSSRERRDSGVALVVDYSQLFGSTRERNLALTNLSWREQGDRLLGEGRFEASYVRSGKLSRQVVRGRVSFELVREANVVRLVRLNSHPEGASG